MLLRTVSKEILQVHAYITGRNMSLTDVVRYTCLYMHKKNQQAAGSLACTDDSSASALKLELVRY